MPELFALFIRVNIQNFTFTRARQDHFNNFLLIYKLRIRFVFHTKNLARA